MCVHVQLFRTFPDDLDAVEERIHEYQAQADLCRGIDEEVQCVGLGGGENISVCVTLRWGRSYSVCGDRTCRAVCVVLCSEGCEGV